MSLFSCSTIVDTPEAVRPFLADPVKHWKKGYSAFELATSWVTASGFPMSVRNVMEACAPYAGAQLIEGFFEREVDLRTPGRPSQTDLLVLARLRSGHAVIAVEGKVAEPFGPLVSEWRGGDGKERRLQSLSQSLGLRAEATNGLRYQLLHRTASALYEAERYGFGQALMLVHSFSLTDESLGDFRNFADAFGVSGAGRNTISSARLLNGIELRLGWVADRPSP